MKTAERFKAISAVGTIACRFAAEIDLPSVFAESIYIFGGFFIMGKRGEHSTAQAGG